MSVANDDAPRGFVSMREYLRLKERCEDLEERLALVKEDERDNASDDLVLTVRSAMQCAKQPARLIIALAQSRHNLVAAETIIRATDMPRAEQVQVVVWKLNKTAAARGWPKLVIGHPGHGRGGYSLTAEGRAFIADRVPDLFDTKGQAA